MHKLTVDTLGVIKPMMEKHIAECAPGRITFEYARDQLMLWLLNDLGCVSVDSLENPTAYVVASSGRLSIFDEDVCFVNVFYVLPEKRAEVALLDELYAVVEEFAARKKSDQIYASSWVFNGSKPMTAYWARKGFTEQETLMVKEVA